MTDDPDAESISARDLWEHLVTMSREDKGAFLDRREFLVDGEWRSFTMAEVWRSPGTPLLLYTDWPSGEFQVPMGNEIPVRPRP